MKGHANRRAKGGGWRGFYSGTWGVTIRSGAGTG
jgi:hypothetical protein